MFGSFTEPFNYKSACYREVSVIVIYTAMSMCENYSFTSFRHGLSSIWLSCVVTYSLYWTLNTPLPLRFYGHFPRDPGLASFIGAKDDGGGGDNWSCMTCKAPVKLSPPVNQHPTFYRPDALCVTQTTVSEHWREILHTHPLILKYTGWMPFLSPNQRCQSTEGKLNSRCK